MTVAAKLLLPFLPDLIRAVTELLLFLGPWTAEAIAWVVFALLPGFAGFMVWELKENWRLYAANRARMLRPAVIGTHGETMRRLLRPGFHSGTLPRLYGRLRRAERRARLSGNTDGPRKQRAALAHVEQAVRRFLQREFVALINSSFFWRDTALGLGGIELGSNRIRGELRCPALGTESVWLAFEERSGWLLAGVSGPGWLPQLSDDQRRALTTALAGLYKRTGIQLIHEQIGAVLPAGVSAYDVVEEGLVVWSGPDFAAEAVYPLSDGLVALPRVTAGSFPQPLPSLPLTPLLFQKVEIAWSWWLKVWEDDQRGQAHPAAPAEGVCLLPP